MHPSVTPMIIAPYIAKWILQMKLMLTSGCQGEYLGRSILYKQSAFSAWWQKKSERFKAQGRLEEVEGGCVEEPEESL